MSSDHKFVMRLHEGAGLKEGRGGDREADATFLRLKAVVDKE